MHIVLYTLPTCPICEMIKKKLNDKNFYYEEVEFSKLPKYVDTDRAPVMAIMSDVDFTAELKDGIIPVDVNFILSPAEMVEAINSWE